MPQQRVVPGLALLFLWQQRFSPRSNHRAAQRPTPGICFAPRFNCSCQLRARLLWCRGAEPHWKGGPSEKPGGQSHVRHELSHALPGRVGKQTASGVTPARVVQLLWSFSTGSPVSLNFRRCSNLACYEKKALAEGGWVLAPVLVALLPVPPILKHS